MDDRISRDVFIWTTLRERLAVQHEMDEADPSLIDTLDGETTLNENLGKVAMSAKEDEAHAEAIKALITDMQTRKARLERRADYKRGQIAWAMQETGQTSIKLPGVTLSMTTRPPSFDVDKKILPDEYKKTKTELVPDNDLIAAALADGLEILGVTKTNACPSLRIGSK